MMFGSGIFSNNYAPTGRSGGPQPAQNPFMGGFKSPFGQQQSPWSASFGGGFQMDPWRGIFQGPQQFPFFGSHPLLNFSDFSWAQSPLSPQAPLTGQGILAAQSRDVAPTQTPKTVDKTVTRADPDKTPGYYSYARNKAGVNFREVK